MITISNTLFGTTRDVDVVVLVLGEEVDDFLLVLLLLLGIADDDADAALPTLAPVGFVFFFLAAMSRSVFVL